MPDEPKIIEPLFGPYKGSHITVPAADADEAISGGYARDPYDASYEPAELDEDERAELEELAVKAARKWRGEEDDPADKKAKPAATAETAESESEVTRDIQAEETSGTGYRTREATTKRGRPPKPGR